MTSSILQRDLFKFLVPRIGWHGTIGGIECHCQRIEVKSVPAPVGLRRVAMARLALYPETDTYLMGATLSERTLLTGKTWTTLLVDVALLGTSYSRPTRRGRRHKMRLPIREVSLEVLDD